MKNFLVAFLSLLLISSTAFAYDDLLAFTVDSMVNEQGSKGIIGGLVYHNAGDTFDNDSEKQSLADDMTTIRVPIVAGCTPRENLGVFAILPIVSMDNGVDTESGIGDIWLGAKYAVMPQGLFTVRGALNLGTGDDEKGLGNAGGFGLDLAVQHQKPIIENLLIGRAQAGIRWMGEDSETKWQPGMGLYAKAGLLYQVKRMGLLHCGFELMTAGEGSNDGNDVDDSNTMDLDLQVGFIKMLSASYGFHAGFDIPVAGTNVNAEMGFGLAGWYSF